jgi:hypothetical protein
MDFIRPVGSLEEALKIGTGEANSERLHGTAPVYFPLADPVPRETALGGLSPRLRDAVTAGHLQLVAIAAGTMGEEGERRDKVQFVLLWGKPSLHEPDDPVTFWTFETVQAELEEAVLMDGHGRRYAGPALSREEAVGLWVARFLNWNCERPGLYRLRFAYVGA